MKTIQSIIRNTTLILLLTFLSGGLFTCHSLAQGTAFTYQGRLNDGGTPANGSYDLRFVLYDAEVGGSQQGPILTTNGVAVSNGVFTVALDFGNQFSGAARWLEVAVRTNNVGNFNILNPRQSLTPAPYAVFANAASNLTGTVSASQLNGMVTSANLPEGLGGTGNAVTGLQAVVGGGLNNYAGKTLATIGGGNANTNNGYGGFIGGGLDNTATGGESVVGGGDGNFAQGLVATIGGGYLNTASGPGAFVGGGGWDGARSGGNLASGSASVIGGGMANTNSGYIGTIGGGDHNRNSANEGTIGGGQVNTVSGDYQPTVGGGYANQATNSYATVPGGYGNIAGGLYSFAAGHFAQALHQGAFVWADSQAATFSSTANNQFLIRAQGGVGVNAAHPDGALAVNTGAGTVTVRSDGGLTPGIDITNGYLGTLRLRNAMEVWPSDDASRAGRLDVRDTNGTPTISLNGQSGAITANSCSGANGTLAVNGNLNVSGSVSGSNTPRVNWDQNENDGLYISFGSSPVSVTSFGNLKPAPGFFVIIANLNLNDNGNTVYLTLNDVSSGSVRLAQVATHGLDSHTMSLFCVVPITSGGGYQNFQLAANTDSGTSHYYGYNLTVMYFPLPRNN